MTDKKVFAALIEAQKSIRGIVKTGRNSFQKYTYATTESMITECREALHSAGLTLVVLESRIDEAVAPNIPHADLLKLGKGKESISTFAAAVSPTVLRKKYALLCADGSSLEMRQDWPVFVENGRGPDKAVAAAVTASLGYFLRDLLLIPRVDDSDELDSTKAQEAQQAEEAVYKKALSVVGGLFKGLGLGKDDVGAWCKDYNATTPRDMSIDELGELAEALRAVPVEDKDGSNA